MNSFYQIDELKELVKKSKNWASQNNLSLIWLIDDKFLASLARPSKYHSDYAKLIKLRHKFKKLIDNYYENQVLFLLPDIKDLESLRLIEFSAELIKNEITSNSIASNLAKLKNF
jgi:hypothetical protein